MIYITEGFLEVAIECWPEWDLNPQPLIYKKAKRLKDLKDLLFHLSVS